MQSVTTLKEVIGRLSDSDQEFARSLLDQAASRGLSDKQAAWVDRLVIRANSVQPALVNVMALVDFMHDAAIKRPVLRLSIGERDIRLAIAGPGSRAPGYIVVTSADRAFEDRQFYGRIAPDGTFEPSLAVEPDTQAAIVTTLQAMATDPAGTAATYGKLTGSCCFCSLPLTDPMSLDVGYGKICARKYHLPWGTN